MVKNMVFEDRHIPYVSAVRHPFLLLILICLFFCESAKAATYEAKGDKIGEITYYQVKNGDNLYDIARRHDLGIVELLTANPGVDPQAPKAGTELTLTTEHILPPVRQGIVLNLSEFRLFYFTKDGKVMTFPVGIGREGWHTPTGTAKIQRKRKHPTWTPPPSIRAENPNLPESVPPGPNNPLGDYALDLGWQAILIHSTNYPRGIGKRSSHGCIRLYPEDIKTLFNTVSLGTPVTILDQPYKLGQVGDDLFLEVTQTQTQADAIAAYRKAKPVSLPKIYDVIHSMAGNGIKIDRAAVDDTISRHDGIPTLIGQKRATASFYSMEYSPNLRHIHPPHIPQ